MSRLDNFDPNFLSHFVPATDYKLEEARQARWEAGERDAAFTFQALQAQVEALQESAIADGAEVGLMIPFAAEVVHVRQVGWQGRNTLFVVGTLNKKPVRLVLHHSQLQMLLVPVMPEAGGPARVLYLVPPKDNDPTTDEEQEAEDEP